VDHQKQPAPNRQVGHHTRRLHPHHPNPASCCCFCFTPPSLCFLLLFLLPLLCPNRQMRVEWTTKDSQHPVVKWGTTPGVYTHTTPASSSTFSRHDMCGPPANSTGWLHPGVFHSAVLEGLEPGTQYYYVVGDEVRDNTWLLDRGLRVWEPGGTGWLNPGVFHSAVLEGLQSGSQYHNVLGDEVRRARRCCIAVCMQMRGEGGCKGTCVTIYQSECCPRAQ
jgi:hypothetical protein